VRGFGRTIALWNFIAVQQFRDGFEAEFATAATSAARRSMQFVLPNRTPLPATREAGLVQIAEALIQISDEECCTNRLVNRSRLERSRGAADAFACAGRAVELMI
jgi:hypothetical protein